MKYSLPTLEQHKALLDEYNLKQDSVNRLESNEVKKCFTNQAHQTIIACSAILGVTISLMAGTINWYIIATITLLLIALCLMTINVGCHKFNTSNRAIAYQIHLSRITDYEEINKNNKGLLAFELRRIDWEEAMFARRVVQPHIYDYFYKRSSRNERKKAKDYPWYDSKKLIDTEIKKEKGSISGSFYPGTYLRKMLYKLYFVILLLTIGYFTSINNIIDDFSFRKIEVTAIICLSILPFIYVSAQVVNSYFKCKKLESGLVSIQTSAFVWRIVCITLLLAKQKSIKENLNKNSINQIYRGYTIQLARIASGDLYNNIHRAHDWIGEKELEIINNINKISS